MIDPSDGTNNFVTQKGRFCSDGGLFEDGSSHFGLIYDVMQDHLLQGGEFPVYRNDLN